MHFQKVFPSQTQVVQSVFKNDTLAFRFTLKLMAFLDPNAYMFAKGQNYRLSESHGDGEKYPKITSAIYSLTTFLFLFFVGFAFRTNFLKSGAGKSSKGEILFFLRLS